MFPLRPYVTEYRTKLGSLVAAGLLPGLLFSACRSTVSESPPIPESVQSPLLTVKANSSITNTTSVRIDNVLPPVEPLDVRGDLLIAGSNSMAPLAEAVAERFIDEGFSGELDIEIVGSGAGFEVFCQEGSDIAIASRAITPAEQQACAAMNRRPVALPVGRDALAIVVSEDNDFLESVTRQELAKIFTVEYWSEVRPNWPEELIRRTIPEPGSGALDLFTAGVLDGDLQPLLQAANVSFVGEDEDYLVQALISDPYAITFFSYTYYRSNRDSLQPVSIEGASPDSRADYPLVRPLLLYADANDIGVKPQIGAFLNFFMTHANEEMTVLGYTPLVTQQLDDTKTELLTLLNQTASEASN